MSKFNNQEIITINHDHAHQFNGNCYFNESIASHLDNHPLKFIASKLDDDLDAERFEDFWMCTSFICSFKDGLPDGPIEVFNEEGLMILEGGFDEGMATGKWRIYHLEGYSFDYFESFWEKGQQKDSSCFFSCYELVEEGSYKSLNVDYNSKGEISSISHKVYGYWSNYADPLDTFEITYKFNKNKLQERVIIQFPFWNEPETLISSEFFDETGKVTHSEVHPLITKHNAYQSPMLLSEFNGYDDDDSAETLMCRTIDLLCAKEISGTYREEFNSDYCFGPGFKYKDTSNNLKEIYYFAWGNKWGLSLHFNDKNALKELRDVDNEVIWDVNDGFNKKIFHIKTINIEDILKN